MQKKIITFLLLILTNNILAQSSFFRDTSINVIENNLAFKNAWASGINSAQFNEIDLDLDGNITKEANDTITTTCKMFLTDTAAWSGGDVVFRIANGNGDNTGSITVNTETLSSIDATYTVTGTNYLDIHSFQFNTMGSQPNSDSTVFLAKVKVVVKKADGTIKATRTFDTSECASVNPFTGLNKFQPSTAVASDT